jgi:hypothetical protein
VNRPVPKGLVPPRPNLGPEPWPAGPPVTAIIVAIAAGLLIIAVLILARRARKGRRVSAGDGAPARPAEVNARDQMVALSASIRQALTDKLGTGWRAKTTEEVAIDPDLQNLLGREHLDLLSRFLDRVDHLKFAPERSNEPEESLERQLAAWQPRVVELTAKIQTKLNSTPPSQDRQPRPDSVRTRGASYQETRPARNPFPDNGKAR